MIRLSVFALLAVIWAPISAQQLIDTPASNTFNGISTSPDGALTIAVGNGGEIVHITSQNPGGVLVNSGTMADLFDVHVNSADFAVASGLDVLLTWDGESWTPLLEDDFSLPYRPVWATPEQDLILYRSTCRVPPGLPQDRFCFVGLNKQTLGFCGRSNDIKEFRSSGDIWHIDNFLNNPIDPLDTEPLFDHPGDLNLTAVWVPPAACFGGPVAPAQAFGISNFNQIWRFDGSAWSLMSADIPADQTLTWLGGTGASNLYAVGFKPTATKGPAENEAVLWYCDDAGTCTDQSASRLPPNTPGATDIAITSTYQGCIKNDGGFEQSTGNEDDSCQQPAVSCQVSGLPGVCTRGALSSENGKAVTYGSEVAPPVATDIATIVKIVDRKEVYAENEPITYKVRVFNNGPLDASNVFIRILALGLGPPLERPITHNCQVSQPNPNELQTTLATLRVNDFWNCELQTTAVIADFWSNAHAGAPDDWNPANNLVFCNQNNRPGHKCRQLKPLAPPDDELEPPG